MTDRQHSAPSTSGATLAPENAIMAEEFGLLIDGAVTYAIYMLDAQGLVTHWNRGAERIQGWSEAEIIGRNFAIFYPPDAAEEGKPQADLTHATANGRLEEESWQLRKDGSEFLAEVTLTALHDDRGGLRGFSKVVRDITDQTAAKAAVVRREQHLRSILASIPDAMIVFDNRGIISSFSTAAETMFGYAREEAIGRYVGELIPDIYNGTHAPLKRVVVEKGVKRIFRDCPPEKATRKNGESFPIELAVGEASIGGERIFTGFVRDVTTRRTNERRMQELRSELVHVSRVSAMGTMASTLAHEISQPLTAIASYLETTRAMIGENAEPLLAEVAEALEAAAMQSVRVGNIVRRLREFVDGGGTGFRIERLDALIEEATSLGILGAHEAGISVKVAIAAGRNSVLVDRIQIEQVLVNLIRNAIHSMETSPRKELTIATAPDRDGWMRVTVADTGVGIDSGIRERLFEAFATTKEDGMGLGLSICRTIVEAHGGRIWADAPPDGGTAFHFCIPLAAKDDV